MYPIEAQVPVTHASLRRLTRAPFLKWEATPCLRMLCGFLTPAEILGQKEGLTVPVTPQQGCVLLTTSNQEGPESLPPLSWHT